MLAGVGVLVIAVAITALIIDDVPPLRADALAAGALLIAIAAWAWTAMPKAAWAALAIPIFLADQFVQTWDSPEIGLASAEGHMLEGLAD